MMKILIFTPVGHGPSAAASLPLEYNAEPDFYQLPGTPPAVAATLHDKGPGISWEDWAGHLAKRTGGYAGTWSVEEVPDAWRTRPDMLHRALAQAQGKASLA